MIKNIREANSYLKFWAIALLIIVCSSIAFYAGTRYDSTALSQQVKASSYASQSAATDTEVSLSPDGFEIPTKQLKACQAAAPLIDAAGNPSGAKRDATYVYDEGCNILVGADPKIFVALDYYYGKDSIGVWMLAQPSDEGSPAAVRLVGADPSTFSLIPDPRFAGISEGYSSDYTKTSSTVYYDGHPMIAPTDPTTFLVNDPMGTTTCVFDAHDRYWNYYQGTVVPQQGDE